MPQEQKSRKSGKKSSAENQEKSGPDFVFFLLLLFFPPLIFFTEITRNPYIIQNLVFQTGIGILLLWKLIRSRGIISLPKTPADRPLALWGGYILLSIFCSLVLYPEHRDAFFSFWRGRIIFFLFNALAVYYLSAHYSRSSRQLDRIFYTVIFASTLSSFYALMQYSGNEFIWPQNLHHYGSRAVSTFGNPNFLSSYLLVVNMILLYLFFRRKGGTSVLFLLFFNLFALLITQTRSSWFGFLVSAILFIILAAPGLRGLSRKISLLAGLAILTVLVFPRLAYLKDHPQVWDRILDARRFDSAATAQAVRQRLMIWEAAWKIFKDSPLLGHGWGSFELLYPYKQGELLLKRKIYTPYRTHANNTHNEIMEVLSQTGAAGLLLYAFLWYVFFSSLFRARRSDGSGLILLSLSVAAGYFTDNLLNVTLHFPMPAILFWMLCGIGMGRCTEDKYNIDLKKYFPFLMTVGSAAALFFFIFQVHLWLGEVYYFRGFKTSRLPGRLEESVKWCRRSWEMYPYNVDNNYEMGNSYARLGDTGNAIWAYGQALRANQGYDEIYFNLGVMHIKKGELDEAEKMLRESVRINPVSEEALLMLANFYVQQRQNSAEGVKNYKRVLDLNPENSDAWNNLAYIYMKQGDRRGSYEAYRKTLLVNPGHELARQNILGTIRELGLPYEKKIKEADGYISRSEWAKAEKSLREALEINPGDLKSLFFLANTLVQLARPDEAAELYQRILKYRQDPMIHLNLARVYRLMGKPVLAEEEEKKAGSQGK